MMKLSHAEMVRAMRANDASYDGRYYVGVLSTGIYCLPSCRARRPQLKNVIFLATREEAIAAGLRGCKKCRAETYPDVLPEWLHRALAYMRGNRGEKLNENMLMDITGVDITTVRRYFKNHLGLTPMAFHRKLRLNLAKELIESGKSYLQAAFECGYESSSGFREAFVRQFALTPGKYYERA